MAKSCCFHQGSLGQEVKPLWSAEKGRAVPAADRLTASLLTQSASLESKQQLFLTQLMTATAN